jgi:thioredoxin reductase
MTGFPEVVIIGAGPYGLSTAAHLAASGVSFRIFGRPMAFWQEHMPQGMLLKSDGYASNISDPAESFRLQDFCTEKGLPYADEGIPVSLERFVAYGLAFQQRLVPEVEQRTVTSVERTQTGFLVRLDDGELVPTARVVVAVGIGHFAYLPPVFCELPTTALTHSSVHRQLTGFKRRRVCVVGGGASAIDTAALLHEAGASVQLVARQIAFHTRLPLVGRTIWQRIREPHSGIGGGWRQAAMATAPLVFRALPEQLRIRVITRQHAPSGGWAMRDRVIGKFPILEGYTPKRAWVQSGDVCMTIAQRNGTARDIVADHVIAATGYNHDLERLAFLGPAMRARLRVAAQSPILSPNFECSIPGMYFIGPIAKYTFGPLLRFVYGAQFAARQTSKHIVRSGSRRHVVGHAAAGAD